MVSDRAFTFHWCIPCGQTFSLVSRLRSDIMVTFFNEINGALVFHRNSLVFFLKMKKKIIYHSTVKFWFFFWCTTQRLLHLLIAKSVKKHERKQSFKRKKKNTYSEQFVNFVALFSKCINPSPAV